MKWLFDRIKEVIGEILSSYEDIFDYELLHRTKEIISEVIEKLLLKKHLRLINKKGRVVKHPHSYYVLTTFHVLNLPCFAAFCSSCDKFNNLRAKYIVGKLRQIGAEYGISGGFSFMIKILFICHGTRVGLTC